MKLYLAFILLFFSLAGFAQSKKELQEQVVALTSEKQKLVDEKQKLMEDVLDLKQKILDLNTENLNYKNENKKLKTSLSSGNNKAPISINGLMETPNGSNDQTSGGRCQAITAKGVSFPDIRPIKIRC